MLEIRNLSKSYGEKKAVCNLNLIVEDGDIMGFIGKNGAGKTTTLKSCLGIVGIDKGENPIRRCFNTQRTNSLQKENGICTRQSTT